MNCSGGRVQGVLFSRSMLLGGSSHGHHSDGDCLIVDAGVARWNSGEIRGQWNEGMMMKHLAMHRALVVFASLKAAVHFSDILDAEPVLLSLKYFRGQLSLGFSLIELSTRKSKGRLRC